MVRKDEFDDNDVKKQVIDYFIALHNKKYVDEFICLDSYYSDDKDFGGQFSPFDGFMLINNNRYAFIEVKERSEEWEDPLIEFKKIDRWLANKDKWNKFYYLNLMPSGLWVLAVHKLDLESFATLYDVVMDGVKIKSFNRNKERLGGVRLKSDYGKYSLCVNKKYWVKLDKFRRNNDE